MKKISKEKIIESIRDGAILTDPGTLLGHMCVLLIGISESMHEGNETAAFATAIDGCEIATECVEMWIRLFGDFDMNEVMQHMQHLNGENDFDKLLDHIASIKSLAARGRAIIDAKNTAN